MPSSLVIAQMLGPLYVIVAVGLAVNSSLYQRLFDEFFESPALTFLGGFLALAFGLLILAFHPTWNADWTVIVTLVGWLGLLKGSLLIVRPGAVLGLSRALMASPARLRAGSVVPLALGLFLGAKGFGFA